MAETSVVLTEAELLLLRQRLSPGPGLPAVDSVLDAKLYAAQMALKDPESDEDLIRRRMAEAQAKASVSSG